MQRADQRERSKTFELPSSRSAPAKKFAQIISKQWPRDLVCDSEREVQCCRLTF